MIRDSPELCAARRDLLARELDAYRDLPADRRRRAERTGLPASPPDALIELRVVDGALAVRSDRLDVIVRDPQALLRAVLGSLPPGVLARRSS